MSKLDILSYNLENLEEIILEMGESKFRAKQIFRWLHIDRVESFEEMTNISKDLREKLDEKFEIKTLEIHKRFISKIDGTRKYLFRLEDGQIIESVMMPYKHGNTVCVSSQAGCRMGCKFCASTLNGLDRNLTTSEILGQSYAIEKDMGERVSHIVLMGSGEPLDNFDNVMQFIRVISDDNGTNISKRNITLSTCGLVDGIKKLADLGFPVTLALSLHAADDETRKKIMPIANKYTIQEELDACWYLFEKTGRRVSFEYSLINGVNDSPEDAVKLGKLIGGKNVHINLIPMNPVDERDLEQSTKQRIEAFCSAIEKYHINVTIRREMGRDINGACGQLRNRELKNEANGE